MTAKKVVYSQLSINVDESASDFGTFTPSSKPRSSSVPERHPAPRASASPASLTRRASAPASACATPRTPRGALARLDEGERDALAALGRDGAEVYALFVSLNFSVMWAFQTLLSCQDVFARRYPERAARLNFLGIAASGGAMAVGYGAQLAVGWSAASCAP